MPPILLNADYPLVGTYPILLAPKGSNHFVRRGTDRLQAPVWPPLVDPWYVKHLCALGLATRNEGEARLRAAAAGFAALEAPRPEALARRRLLDAGRG